MASRIPPGAPPLGPAPIRTPLDVMGKLVYFKDSGPWTIWLNLVFNALSYLFLQPVSLSGLAADIPDATLYPENSRYWATNTMAEYIDIYATPGDPTTAAWVAM